MIGNEITSVASPTVQQQQVQVQRADVQKPVEAPEPKLESNNIPKPQRDYVVANIRVDVDLDMAILEFKSLETGDIVRQYPTEKQLAGYQRAAQLEARRDAREQTFVENAQIMTRSLKDAPASASTQSNTAQGVATATINAGGSGAAGNVTAGTAQLSDTSSAAS